MKRIVVLLLLFAFSVITAIVEAFVEPFKSAAPRKFVPAVIGSVSKGFSRRERLCIRTCC